MSAADSCLRHGAVQLDATGAYPCRTVIIKQMFYFYKGDNLRYGHELGQGGSREGW
jgi:hypothetical protein